MEKEFDQEAYQKAVRRMLDYAKRTNKDYVEILKKVPLIDLKPCKNCGRVVYIGKCCDNPDYEVEIFED